MDWGTAAQWAAVAVAVLLSAWAAFSKLSEKALADLQSAQKQDRQDRKTEGATLQSDLRRLFERVDGIEGRVGKIEVEVEHLPTKNEVHAIDSKIVSLDGRVVAMIDRVNTLINLYERAQDRLAEAERK